MAPSAIHITGLLAQRWADKLDQQSPRGGHSLAEERAAEIGYVLTGDEPLVNVHRFQDWSALIVALPCWIPPETSTSSR